MQSQEQPMSSILAASSKTMPNKSGQADRPPRRIFVLDSTSLAPLRPAAYH